MMQTVEFETSLCAYWLESVPEGKKYARVIKEAAVQYALATGHDPQFVFVHEIPPGAEEFMEVYGLSLVRSDWVPARTIAIGRGGCEEFKPEYRKWRRTEENHG